jgi:DNA-binding CsgD family transcriptional regulator
VQRVFEEFVQGLVDAVDEVDLRQALTDTATAFDLRQFAYLSLQRSTASKPGLISNYPIGWTDHYLRNRYDKSDPVIAHAQASQCPFHWGADVGSFEACSQGEQLFEEAAAFGIRSGFTVPVGDRRGGVAALTFATDEPNPPFMRVTERYEQAFQLLATCFHIHARRMLSADRTVNGVSLTPREYECLQWASRGKSASEIGDILGIKRRTAAFHLDNVRHKLGVRTIVQAVACLASSRPNLH